MKPVTYYLMILDRSGSMGSCKAATISAFNEKVQQIKLQADEQEILCSLYTFNGNVYEHCVDVPPAELAELTDEDYITGGSTAMYKAVGYAVDKLRERTEHLGGDVAFLVEIFSDGENTDTDFRYTPDAVAELIAGCQDTGRWTFGYIGNGHDLSKVTKQLHIPAANVAKIAMDNNVAAAASYHQVNSGTENFMRMRRVGVGGQSVMRSSNLYSNSDSLADFTNDLPDLTKTVGSSNVPLDNSSSPLLKSAGRPGWSVDAVKWVADVSRSAGSTSSRLAGRKVY